MLFDKIPFNRCIGTGLDRIYFIGEPTTVSVDLIIYTQLLYNSSPDNIDFSIDLKLYVSFGDINFTSDVENSLALIFTTYFPLEGIEFFGDGSLELNTIGLIILSLFTLLDISLPPGQSIEIDTDAMTVLFKQTNTYDVSSITPYSTFFELGPDGENQIKFSAQYLPKLVGGEKILPPNGANDLKVVTIWSERWL